MPAPLIVPAVPGSHPLPDPSPAPAGEGFSWAIGKKSPSPLRGGGVGEGGDARSSAGSKTSFTTAGPA